MHQYQAQNGKQKMKHLIMKFERRLSVKIKFCTKKKNFIYLFVFVIEICNRNPNKTSLDANTVWLQVVSSLSDQSSIHEALPVGGGFISK